MRLIDADALMIELQKCIVENQKIHRAVTDDDLETLIRDAPTIEPVRRGKWVPDEADKWRCSVCGIGNNYAYKWSVRGNELQDKYCPNCGARMDGGTENE